MMQRFSTGSFVAGVMLGVLLTGAWFLGGAASLTSPPSSALATTTPPVLSGSNAVSVADQPAGDAVTIESVTVPPPGVWVAVREMLGNDLGNVLGAARASGPRSNFVVPLLRGTEPGRTYAIELYRDDDNGAFDPAAEQPGAGELPS
ncbi:MAG TPA: hypothetical protein PLW99_00280, partial [Candidatus Paceibacterota bacterium]|nr:hypothetical protein [Candidatus Paceibacterota bacterium]